MHKILAAATGGILFPSLAFAQEGGIDQAISNAIKPIVTPIVDTIFYSVPVAGTNFPLIVGWLIVAAIIFTVYFRFIQFRAFKHAIELVRGDYADPNDAGEVSHFQALATALSGTVGLGNIAGAFAPEAVGGGIVGVLIQGLKRATFSNEAGVGSAPIAHSAVRTKEPVTEGIVALLEPFIDTVVICTMTALVIVVTGTYQIDGLGGVGITSAAFESAFSWFPYVLTLAVLLFAFSTMIAWSYYGLKAWTYLFGESKRADVTFKAIFCVFVVIGASIQLGPVIDFSDAMFFAMSIANIIGLYILLPVVKKEVTEYVEKVRTGVIVKHA